MTAVRTPPVGGLNNRTNFSYDALDRLTSVLDPLGRRSTLAYDAVGNVTAAVDALNYRTTFGYDALDRLTSVLDALGGRTTLAYDAVGNVVATVDALGRRTTAVYDNLDRPQAVIDALNQRVTAVWDAADQLTATVDALGRRTTYSYDVMGQVQSVLDALGGRTTFLYDLNGNPIATVDALNRRTTFGYDLLNRPVETLDALGGRATLVYDAVGNVVAVVNPLNQRTTYSYDALDRVSVVQDALGNRTTLVYDAAGDLSRVINPRGYTTTYTHDELHRLRTVKDAAGGTATYGYDEVGNLRTYTDPRGGKTTYSYDALRRLVAVTDPLGHTGTAVYDAVGNVTAQLDALGYATTFGYDALDRVVLVTQPSGGVWGTSYDAAGNVVSGIDPLGHITTLVYDALDRPIAQIDARNYRTTAVYDAVGNRTVLIDAQNNRTTFSYDALDRVTAVTDPLNNAATYAYDAASRLTSTTDRLGRRRDFGYDAVGQLTSETWVGGSGGALTYAYDAAGNLTKAANAAGTLTYTYDALDRVATTKDMWNVLLTFTYDASSNRTKVQDSFGGVTTSVYDAADRLTSRQYSGQGATLRFDYGYTARDELEGITRYSDLTGLNKVGATSLTYDATGRLQNLKHQDAAGTWSHNVTYTYDLAHRLTWEQTNGTYKGYGYDVTDQLTNDGGTAYTYDGTGNRTMTDYQTGPGNQLLNDGTWTYTYDAEGNRTKKSRGASQETWTYGYDHRNQLIWVEKRASDGGTLIARIDYRYDAFGRRVERSLDSDGNGTPDSIQRYSYDGGDVIADLDSFNNLQTRRLYSDSYLAAPEARVTSAGAVAWYMADRLGSVVALSDSAGVVQDRLTYDGFGKVLTESGYAFGDRFKYTGQERDEVTGDSYHSARYYDPSIGRWLTRDPIGFAAGDANLYRYVGNNSTNYVDPSGLFLTAEVGNSQAIQSRLNELGVVTRSFLLPRRRPWRDRRVGIIPVDERQVQDALNRKDITPYDRRILESLLNYGMHTTGNGGAVSVTDFDDDEFEAFLAEIAKCEGARAKLAEDGQALEDRRGIGESRTRTLTEDERRTLEWLRKRPGYRDWLEDRKKYARKRMEGATEGDIALSKTLDALGRAFGPEGWAWDVMAALAAAGQLRSAARAAKAAGAAPKKPLPTDAEKALRNDPLDGMTPQQLEQLREGLKRQAEAEQKLKNLEAFRKYIRGELPSEADPSGALRRRMLEQGKPPSHLKKPEAHHDLPQQFRDKFEKAGLDIDDPAHGRWVEGGRHQGWSPEFNEKWSKFFDQFKDGKPTAQDILDFRDKMRQDPRFQ